MAVRIASAPFSRYSTFAGTAITSMPAPVLRSTTAARSSRPGMNSSTTTLSPYENASRNFSTIAARESLSRTTATPRLLSSREGFTTNGGGRRSCASRMSATVSAVGAAAASAPPGANAALRTTCPFGRRTPGTSWSTARVSALSCATTLCTMSGPQTEIRSASSNRARYVVMPAKSNMCGTITSKLPMSPASLPRNADRECARNTSPGSRFGLGAPTLFAVGKSATSTPSSVCWKRYQVPLGAATAWWARTSECGNWCAALAYKSEMLK
mmetsp:Transcript_20594/g.51972  ORF Transcript_20594/g.51972 Transcript_20594/m.51972 type:complete len:270 (+) Transcript_20594:3470-4279(+)